jgi:luciferase family oxidoreductase group 1
VWLLGSSPQSAIWAGELGLPYVFADFINPAGAEIAELYRRRFLPSRRRDTPYVGVAVSVVCAEDDEDAQRLASSAQMAMTLLRQGRLIAVPPVETALAFFEQHPPPSGRRAIVGSPETVRAGIEAVVADYGADEAMIVTITYDHEARRRSYELVAGAFRVVSPAVTR